MNPPTSTDVLIDHLLAHLPEDAQIMDVHQMLYFVHAWALVDCPSACVESSFVAGVYGPFHPVLHTRFSGRLMKETVRPDDVKYPGHTPVQATRQHVKEVLEAYLPISRHTRTSIQQTDPSYVHARQGKTPAERGGVMMDHLIEAHYRRLLEETP